MSSEVHPTVEDSRVVRARSLLLRGRPVGEIAPEVRFADQPHLTRHFRRHLGVPPGAYRRGLLPRRTPPR